MKLKVGAKYPEYDNYWSMDRISGNSLIDEKGNNGTIYGATQVDGKIGKALSFDGVDDYVSIPVGSTYINRNSYSISCWFKLDTLKKMNSILSIGDSPTASSPNFILRSDDADLKTYTRGGTFYATIGIVEANKWYHVVITRTSIQEKAYINNILVSTRTITNELGTSDNIYFGTGYGGKVDGLIDEVLFYNKVLTEEEIAKIYRLSKFKLKVKGNSLNEGLVGYWSMDNISGSDLIAEKGNNGTIYGATQVNGKINKALSFDGLDDYVNTTSTFIDETPFTFSAWFYPNFVNTDAGIVIQSNSAGNRNGVVLTGERLVALVRKELSGGYAYYTTPNAYVVGQWNFVAGVWDGTNAKIFVNGTEYISGSTSSVSNASANITFIGRNQFANGTGTKYFNGLIDEVMIYNRALTLDEIKKIYNNGLGKYKPLNNNLVNVPKIDKTGLVARYTMDNISGTTLIDETGVNNGTIYGATQVNGKINKALSFDGVDDYVIGGSLGMVRYNNSFSCWIKPNDISATQVIFWESSSGMSLGFYTNGVILRSDTYKRWYTNAGLTNGIWSHIAVNYDTDGQPTLYINGVESSTLKSFTQYFSGSGNFYLGKRPNREPYKGELDELMIFNRELSQEEISVLYNSGKGKYSPFR